MSPLESWLVAGLVVSLFISVVAAWRMAMVSRAVRRLGGWKHLYETWAAKRGYEDFAAATDPEAILPQRALFHALVLICLVVEVPIYVFLVTKGPDVAGSFPRTTAVLYALHLASYPLLFAAFSIVVSLWSKLVCFQPTPWTATLGRALLAACAVYSAASAAAIAVCLWEGGPDEPAFFSSRAFAAFCCCSVVALLLLALCLLVFGCMVQARVWRVLGVDGCSAGFAATVARLNAVVLACVACFTLRGLVLLELLFLSAGGADDADDTGATGGGASSGAGSISGGSGIGGGNGSGGGGSGGGGSGGGQVGPLFGWTRWQQAVSVEWLLHAVPCAALLYLMRKTGEVRNAGGGGGGGVGGGRAVEAATPLAKRPAVAATAVRGSPAAAVKGGQERGRGYGTVPANVERGSGR